MNLKKIVSLLLSLTLCLSLVGTAFASGTTQPWYAEAQAYVKERGLMTGTNSGFEPNRPVTKATVLQALYNREGRPDASRTASPWFANAMNWAVKNGLTETFAQDVVVTRAEIFDLLSSYCALKDADSAGLMVGDENGDLKLEQNLTRAELAQVLLRMDTLVPCCTEEILGIELEEQEGIPAHVIPGTLCTPVVTEGQKLPAVVMLHGTGGSRDEAAKSFKLAAAVMAQRGIVTLRIDFMGFGDSKASTTDYNPTSANLDAKAAADYLASLDYVDPDRIAVLGWSQGGTNAMLAAMRYPETFHAAITWAGALNLKTLFFDFNSAYEYAVAYGSYQLTFSWRPPFSLGERWFKEVASTNMVKELTNLETPVLVLNGDLDIVVPSSDAATIARQARNSTLHIIKGANHTYNVHSTDLTAFYEIVNLGVDFLHETFSEKSE